MQTSETENQPGQTPRKNWIAPQATIVRLDIAEATGPNLSAGNDGGGTSTLS